MNVADPLLFRSGFCYEVYCIVVRCVLACVFAGSIADLVQGDSWIRWWLGVLSAEWIFIQFGMQFLPRTRAV